MKIKSDIIWAGLLIGTAAISFFIGTRIGTIETAENLKSSVEEKAERVKVLEYKIQQLSEELTSRGIYSYPQASLVLEEGEPAAKVFITLNGREAIPNLEIERRLIIDYSDHTRVGYQDLQQKGTTTHIGTLSAHNPVTFEIKKFDEEMAMDLIFRSGGNQWHQYIRSRKTAEGDIKTFWVITNEDMEVIDKHVDPEFPLDTNGNLALGPNEKIKFSEIRMNSVFQL